jgi:hypothetical protein
MNTARLTGVAPSLEVDPGWSNSPVLNSGDFDKSKALMFVWPGYGTT